MSQTDAVTRFIQDYEAFLSNGGAVAPEWVQALRKAAIERFGAAGLPTTRHERWRFTSVDSLIRTAFSPAQGVGSIDPARLDDYVIGEPGERVLATTVNGRFLASASTPAGPSGLVVTGLAQAMRDHGDIAREHLGRHASSEENPFTALSTAFVEDGVFVYVPRNAVVDQPVQIVHYTSARGQQLATRPRTLMIVEPGAQLSFIETFAGDEDAVYWTNSATEVVVGENAVVDAYRIQRDSRRSYHTAVNHSYQHRNSVYSLNAFTFGSALNRNDLNAVLDGEGAEATLNGLTVVSGSQHVDYHTTIDHAKPHCNSWELFNGVYDERSRGVFTGRIIVRPGAQKTDSKQTNNNLLLSETARADSQPQLEIYADDVRCTHGATLGPIDQKSLFYLRSRGLTEADARNLLTYGFGAEILNSVSIDELRDQLDRLVHQRLDR